MVLSAEIDDDAIICLKCGCATGKVNTQTTKEADAPSTGYAILGFLIPIIGLILYLIWKNDYPQRASSIGKGAIGGAIFSIIVPILLSIVGVSCLGCIASETYY